MYYFIKTIDKDNKDYDRIQVSTQAFGSTITEMVDLFKAFLLACGYQPENVRLIGTCDCGEEKGMCEDNNCTDECDYCEDKKGE